MSGTFNGGRALLIGIGEGYRWDLRLPRSVRADAEAVARVLDDPSLCGYPKSNVEVLLDEQATKLNILSGLARLAASAAADDTVLFFFSGHGARLTDPGREATYICPADFDPSSAGASGIEAEELSAMLKAIRAARVVVVLDACHAGGAAHLKSIGGVKNVEFGFKGVRLDRLDSGAGRIVFLSCRDDESSQTFPPKPNSLFTHFLLEGLRGAAIDRADGLIHVLDLFHYVSEQVPLNASPSYPQHPVLKVHAENNFPLAVRQGGPSKSAGRLQQAAASPQLDVKALEKVLIQLYPSGPQHNELWSRSGGDGSMLTPGTSGRAAWHSAIRMVSLGGGGANITLASLMETASEDFPGSEDLAALRS